MAAFLGAKRAKVTRSLIAADRWSATFTSVNGPIKWSFAEMEQKQVVLPEDLKMAREGAVRWHNQDRLEQDNSFAHKLVLEDVLRFRDDGGAPCDPLICHLCGERVTLRMSADAPNMRAGTRPLYEMAVVRGCMPSLKQQQEKLELWRTTIQKNHKKILEEAGVKDAGELNAQLSYPHMMATLLYDSELANICNVMGLDHMEKRIMAKCTHRKNYTRCCFKPVCEV